MRLISRWLAVCAVLAAVASHTSSHAVASTRGLAHLRGTSSRTVASSSEGMTDSLTEPPVAGLAASQTAANAAAFVQTGAKADGDEEEEEEEPKELDQAFMAQVLNAPLLSAGGPPANKRALPLIPVDPMEYKGGVKPIHLGMDPDVIDKMYDTNPSDASLMQTSALAGPGGDSEAPVEGPLADNESELEADLIKSNSEAQGLGDTEMNILNGAPRPHGLWTRFPAHDATPLPPVDPQSAPGGVVRMGYDDVRPMQVKKGLFGMFGFLEVSAARHKAARAQAAAARSFSVAGKLSTIPIRTHRARAPVTAEQSRFRQRSSASHGAAREHAKAHHQVHAKAHHQVHAKAHHQVHAKAHHQVHFAAPGPGEELHAWGLEQLQDPLGDKKRRLQEQHALLEQQRRAWKAAMKRQEVMRKAGDAVEQRSSETHAQTDPASGAAEPRFRATRAQMIPTMAQQQQPQQIEMPSAPKAQQSQQQTAPASMPAPMPASMPAPMPASMPAPMPASMPALPASSSLPDDLSTTSMPDDASFQQFRSVLDLGIASPLPAGIASSASPSLGAGLVGSAPMPMQMQMQMQMPPQQQQQQVQMPLTTTPPNGLPGMAADLSGNTLAGLQALQLPSALKQKLATAMNIAAPIAAREVPGQPMQQQPMAFAYSQQQQGQQQMRGAGAESPFQQRVAAAASRLSPGQIQQQISTQMQQMQQRQQQQMRNTEHPAPQTPPAATTAAASGAAARFRQQSASSAAGKTQAAAASESFRVGMSPEHVGQIHQHVRETASPASQRAFRDILADVGLRAGSMEPSA